MEPDRSGISGAVRAYVGLGSNLADPAAQVSRALGALDTLPDTRLVARSRLFRSPPLGPPDQPDYVNAVAALDTSLDPYTLLECLQAIEQRQGRVRGGKRWGPRTLDLDLLLYGELRSSSAVLTLPHPGLSERDFVLWPLADIASELEVPGLGPLRHLMQRCPRRGLRPLDVADGWLGERVEATV